MQKCTYFYIFKKKFSDNNIDKVHILSQKLFFYELNLKSGFFYFPCIIQDRCFSPIPIFFHTLINSLLKFSFL